MLINHPPGHMINKKPKITDNMPVNASNHSPPISFLNHAAAIISKIPVRMAQNAIYFSFSIINPSLNVDKKVIISVTSCSVNPRLPNSFLLTVSGTSGGGHLPVSLVL